MVSESTILIGVIIQAIDNHKTIFIIFDQTIFHITISVCFFILATIDAASSGKLVQIATIVSQITVWDILKDSAIEVADLTITSAQRESQTAHQIINKIDFQIVRFSVCSSASSSRFFIIQNVYDIKIMKKSISIRESHLVIIFSPACEKNISSAINNSASEVKRVKGTSLYTVEFWAFRG